MLESEVQSVFIAVVPPIRTPEDAALDAKLLPITEITTTFDAPFDDVEREDTVGESYEKLENIV